MWSYTRATYVPSFLSPTKNPSKMSEKTNYFLKMPTKFYLFPPSRKYCMRIRYYVQLKKKKREKKNRNFICPKSDMKVRNFSNKICVKSDMIGLLLHSSYFPRSILLARTSKKVFFFSFFITARRKKFFFFDFIFEAF